MSYVDAYPVDGTIVRTISGTDSIQDTWMQAGAADYNYGAGVFFRATTTGNAVIRFNTTDIPAGNITDLSFWYTNYSSELETCNAYRVIDASAWVQGTKTGGTAAAGETTWAHLIYNTVHWAGGANFSSADYVADASPPQLVGTETHSHLPTSWAVGWRDGTYVNNGFCLALAGTKAQSFRSTLSILGGLPYFTISYDAPRGFIYFKII